MKTKIFILMSLFLFTIYSCKEYPDVPEPISSKIWTKVTISNNNVAYNGASQISWETKNVKSITVNGESIALGFIQRGSVLLTGLKEDTDYRVVFSGFNGDEVIKEGTIYIKVVKAEAYASPDSIAYNTNTTLFWNSENVTDVTRDGISISLSGSEKLENLTQDTTFTFKFIGDDKKTYTEVVNIVVANPTRTDTLCDGYMQLFESWYLEAWGWAESSLQEVQKTNKTYFYPDGKWEIIGADGEITGAGGWLEGTGWSWVGKDSIKNGRTYGYVLTDSTFIRIEPLGDGYDIFKRFPNDK